MPAREPPIVLEQPVAAARLPARTGPPQSVASCHRRRGRVDRMQAAADRHAGRAWRRMRQRRQPAAVLGHTAAAPDDVPLAVPILWEGLEGAPPFRSAPPVRALLETPHAQDRSQ
eukprot:360851-Chlamydomonas_euryale.AAC.5